MNFPLIESSVKNQKNKMDIREKYIDFMLENIIPTNIKVQLPEPHEDGKLFWTKLGPTVYMNVELEVIEKYTRSVKFNFKFDRYDVEKIIFIPIESSPMSIKEKLDNTLTNLVYKIFIADGRQDDLKKMYDERRKTMFSGLSKMVGKVVEIEKNYDELYENYCKKCVNNELDNRSKLDYLIEPFGDVGRSTRMYLKDEFIEKLRTDDEFNKKWGGMRKNIVE